MPERIDYAAPTGVPATNHGQTEIHRLHDGVRRVLIGARLASVPRVVGDDGEKIRAVEREIASELREHVFVAHENAHRERTVFQINFQRLGGRSRGAIRRHRNDFSER